MTDLLEGLPIVIDKNTRVLIIGTFPSVESRNKKNLYYYANPNNDFWEIMNWIYGIHIPHNKKEFETLSKPQLLTHKIGLWDVINKCRFKKENSSKDSDIIKSTVIPNDFGEIEKRKIVCLCNGQKAQKWIEICFPNLKIEPCESTSPANRGRFEKNTRYLKEFWGLVRTPEIIKKYWKIKLNKLLGEK